MLWSKVYLQRLGEKIRFEESYKYSLLQTSELWERAGLIPKAVFGNRFNDYRKCAVCSLYMLLKPVRYPMKTISHSFKELV